MGLGASCSNCYWFGRWCRVAKYVEFNALVRVVLKSDPDHATVTQQGVVLGATPLATKVRKGTMQTYTVTMPGYTSKTLTLRPEKGLIQIVRLRRTAQNPANSPRLVTNELMIPDWEDLPVPKTDAGPEGGR